MQSWLRLTLITTTVGGGFAGFAATFSSLFDSPGEGILASTLRVTFLALYGYIVVSGLIFVQNPQRLGPLSIAFGLQVPSFSSPYLVYKLAAGPAVVAGFGSPTQPGKFFTIDWQLLLAGSWQFAILQRDRWQFCINLAALAFFASVWISRQRLKASTMHTSTPS